MPKLKDEGRVEMVSWNYRSPMDAKLALGDRWKADRHYRFVRKDNVDKMRDMSGYTLSGAQFKGLELMETSKEHHHEMQNEKEMRTRARSKSLDENIRREVNRSGQGKVFNED